MQLFGNHHAEHPSRLAPVLAGMLALAAAMGIGRFAFTPLLPMMLEDGNLALADGALLASSNYLGYFLGALSAMLLQIGAATAIRYGLVAIAASTSAMAFPLTLAEWLVLRLLAGIASAWVLISVSSWSLKRLGDRPDLGSLMFSGVGAGIAMAGLVCLGLVAVDASSRQGWAALGFLAFLISALTWPAFETAPERQAPVPPPCARPGWTRDALRLVVCYGLYGFGYIIPATFLPAMAQALLPDAVVFGWSWPLFGLAAALSTLLAVPLMRIHGARRVWIGCHVVMACGVALPAFWPHIAAVFAAAVLVGGTFVVVTVCAVQEAKRSYSVSSTVLIAAMTSAFALGQIAGPLLVGCCLAGGAALDKGLMLAAALLLAGAWGLYRPGARGEGV